MKNPIVELSYVCPHCSKKLNYRVDSVDICINWVCVHCKKSYNLQWSARKPFTILVRSIRAKKKPGEYKSDNYKKCLTPDCEKLPTAAGFCLECYKIEYNRSNKKHDKYLKSVAG